MRDLDGDELGPVPVIPYAQVAAGKLSPEALGARLGSHPLFGGLLVAKDARTASVLVELEGARGAADSRDHVVADLRRLAGQAGLGSAAMTTRTPSSSAMPITQ